MLTANVDGSIQVDWDLGPTGDETHTFQVCLSTGRVGGGGGYANLNEAAGDCTTRRNNQAAPLIVAFKDVGTARTAIFTPADGVVAGTRYTAMVFSAGSVATRNTATAKTPATVDAPITTLTIYYGTSEEDAKMEDSDNEIDWASPSYLTELQTHNKIHLIAATAPADATHVALRFGGEISKIAEGAAATNPFSNGDAWALDDDGISEFILNVDHAGGENLITQGFRFTITSQSVADNAPPTMITTPSVISDTPTIEVNWQRPASGAPTGYEVCVLTGTVVDTNGCNADDKTHSVSGAGETSLSIKLDDGKGFAVAFGTFYEVYIRALYADDAVSTWVYGGRPQPRLIVNPPTGVEAESRDAAIWVTWTKPAIADDVRGAIVNGYYVCVFADGGSVASDCDDRDKLQYYNDTAGTTQIITENTNAPGATPTSIANGTAYRVFVQSLRFATGSAWVEAGGSPVTPASFTEPLSGITIQYATEVTRDGDDNITGLTDPETVDWSSPTFLSVPQTGLGLDHDVDVTVPNDALAVTVQFMGTGIRSITSGEGTGIPFDNGGVFDLGTGNIAELILNVFTGVSGSPNDATSTFTIAFSKESVAGRVPPTRVGAPVFPADVETIRLEWAAPLGAAPNGYQVCVLAGHNQATSGCTAATQYTITDGTVTSLDVENGDGGIVLAFNQAYTVYLRARYAAGTGNAFSVWEGVDGSVTVRETVNPPTAVTASSADEAITVAWTPPTGGGTPNGYWVCIFPDGEGGESSCQSQVSVVGNTDNNNITYISGATTATATLGKDGSTLGHTTATAPLVLANGSQYNVWVQALDVPIGSAWVEATGSPVVPAPDTRRNNATLSAFKVYAGTDNTGTELLFGFDATGNTQGGVQRGPNTVVVYTGTNVLPYDTTDLYIEMTPRNEFAIVTDQHTGNRIADPSGFSIPLVRSFLHSDFTMRVQPPGGPSAAKNFLVEFTRELPTTPPLPPTNPTATPFDEGIEVTFDYASGTLPTAVRVCVVDESDSTTDVLARCAQNNYRIYRSEVFPSKTLRIAGFVGAGSSNLTIANGTEYRLAVQSIVQGQTLTSNDALQIQQQSAWVVTSPASVTPGEVAMTPNIVLSVDKTAYVEGTDDAIEITATATPAPVAELTVNVRVEGGGVGRFFPTGGDARFNNTITIAAGETTGMVSHDIHNDGHQEADTSNQVRATVRDPDTADAYTYENADAPTFMVSNDDQQSAAPTLTSVTAGDTEITVVWSAPSDIGSRDLRNYSVCIADTAQKVRRNNCWTATASDGANLGSKTDFEFSEDQGSDTTDTSYQYTLTGLTNGTDYYVGVAARNGVSRSAFGTFPGVSEYALYEEPAGTAATVTPTGTGTAALPDTALTELSVTGITLNEAFAHTTFDYTTAIGVEVTDFVLTAVPVTGSTVEVTAVGGRGATITAGTADNTYNIAITPGAATIMLDVTVTSASNNEGYYTVAITRPTPPPVPPTTVMATGGNTAITITWDAPASGTSPPTAFTVCFVEGSDTATAMITDDACDSSTNTKIANGDDTTITVSRSDDGFAIDNGTSYVVGVRADHNANTNSAWVAAGPVTPMVPTTANPPTNLSAVVGDATITLTWDVPAAGGLDATGYEVCGLPVTAVHLDTSCVGDDHIEILSSATPRMLAVTTGTFGNLAIENDLARQFAVRTVADTVKSAWSTPVVSTPRSGATSADPNTEFNGLSIMAGDGSAVDLSPVFASGTYDYTVGVANDITQIAITTSTAHAGAQTFIAVDTDDDATFAQVDLAEGENVITITVIAADGMALQRHTITVTREAAPVAADDATLASLAIYAGATATGTPITLTPAFVAGATVTSYDLEVAADVTDVTVAYATTNTAATVTDDEGNTLSGSATYNIGTAATASPQLEVTPPSGADDEVVYTFRITRPATTTPPMLPTLTLTATNSPATEGTNASVSFRVDSNMDAPSAGLEVMVTLSGGDNYVAAGARTQTVRIPGGTNTQAVNFPIDDDDVVEDNAMVTATIGNSDAYTGDGATATATINDDDIPPANPPNPFTIAPKTGVEPNTSVMSDPFSVTGLDDGTEARITVSGGTSNIADGMVSNNEPIIVTVMSECGTVTATVTIGGVSSNFDVTSRTCSSDARLTSLTVTGGGMTHPLTDQTGSVQDVDVAAGVSSVTVTAVRRDPNATVRVNRQVVTGDTTVVDLNGGANEIIVLVTAEDGETRNRLEINVYRDRLPMITETEDVMLGGMVNFNDLASDPDTTDLSFTVTGTPAYGGFNTDRTAYVAPTVMEFEALQMTDSTLTLPQEVTFMLTVTANGVSITRPVTVTITPPSTGISEEEKPALASVASAVTTQISSAISGRISAAAAGSFGGINLANMNDETQMANFIKGHGEAISNGGDLKRLIAGNDFVLPLTATGGGGGGSLSLWASGGIGGVDGDDGNTDWDGDLLNANIGLDAFVRDDLLVGAFLSQTNGDLAFKDSSGEGDNFDYEFDLSGIHPYLSYDTGGVSVWASIGEAGGELERKGSGDSEKFDADLRSYLIGVGLPLSSGDSRRSVNVEINKNEWAIDDADKTKIDSTITKLQLALQQGGGNIAFGLHHAGGDTSETSAELNAGITRQTQRLSIAANLHLLTGGTQQWSINGSVRMHPGSDGQGLSLAMQPTYNDDDEMAVTTQIAYGVGEVTPYAELTTTADNEYGLKWQPKKEVSMKLFGEQTGDTRMRLS